MNDRELIEMAAKAAGMEINQSWNPLTDDGAAMRLAVQLRIDIYHHTFPGEIEAVSESGGVQEDREGDEYCAARRAITRAAAEIGKSM